MFHSSINAFPEYDKTVVEKFGNEVGSHCECNYEILVPIVSVGEHRGPPSGKRCEYQVKYCKFCHRDGDVVCGVECVFAI